MSSADGMDFFGQLDEALSPPEHQRSMFDQNNFLSQSFVSQQQQQFQTPQQTLIHVVQTTLCQIEHQHQELVKKITNEHEERLKQHDDRIAQLLLENEKLKKELEDMQKQKESFKQSVLTKLNDFKNCMNDL